MDRKYRLKILQMVEVGFTEDFISRTYDIINMLAIIVNLIVSILFTFESVDLVHHNLLTQLEAITVFFFLIDYILRLITSDLLSPELTAPKAVIKYIFSFMGLIDLLSFLPYYLPVFFPSGTIAFRMLRVARIFRIFRINAYYDSLNVIAEVLKSKKQQLLSSVFIIIILMTASSLCMYSLEHSVQPEVFSNAFSGIWWAASTLLTVGYGDIYPITTAGKALGILIAFLGVGMVAIPTGIISAGFVEQYSLLRENPSNNASVNLRFIRVRLNSSDSWIGKRIKDISLPDDMMVVLIQRNLDIISPNDNLVLADCDVVVLGSKTSKEKANITLLEVTIFPLHPWCNKKLGELDISRLSTIISIQRNDNTIIPKESTKIKDGDKVLLYTKKRISEADKILV